MDLAAKGCQIHTLPENNKVKYRSHSPFRIVCITGEDLFLADFPPLSLFLLQLLVAEGQREFSGIEKVLTAEWLYQVPVLKRRNCILQENDCSATFSLTICLKGDRLNCFY